ncbi:MAG: ATP-grasp domain-containing protein, partial [Candidatus Methylomirabilaceae bacterium]
PVIVKPSTGSSSVGVYLCHDDEEFWTALVEAAKSVSTEHGNSVMVEEAVDGPEYSAELAWEETGRRWKLVGLTQTHISPPPHRRELGVVFPGMPDSSVAPEIESVLQMWLEAVGLEDAVAHVELRLTPDGPALIEINPRVAGGDIPRIVHHATGIDLVAHYVALHCGQSADLDLQPVRGAGSIWFISPTTEGRLLSMTQPDRPWPSGVDVVYRPLPPRMPVTRQSRLAYVVATAPTPAEALQLATSHAAQHRMEIESC